MFGSMANLYHRFPKGFKKALQHHYFGFTGLVCGFCDGFKEALLGVVSQASLGRFSSADSRLMR